MSGGLFAGGSQGRGRRSGVGVALPVGQGSCPLLMSAARGPRRSAGACRFCCWRALAGRRFSVRASHSATRPLPTGVTLARACFHGWRAVGVAIDCRAEMSPADDAVGRAAVQAPPHGVGALVPRRDLFDVLGRARRVIQVLAPAGSGKTSLLRSWIAEAELTDSVAWVSVAVKERDPQRFWLAVLDAVRVTKAGSALVRELTPAPDLDGGAIVERLLADLSPLDEPIWLVIDDLHELCSDDAFRQLELLVMRSPAELRFVLLSRRELHLASIHESAGQPACKKGMEESYIEDLASHDGPAHALASREGAAKRWCRGARRPVMQPRNGHDWGADVLWISGRQHRWRRFREPSLDPAGSENPCMCVISSC
jgi:AAA domain